MPGSKSAIIRRSEQEALHKGHTCQCVCCRKPVPGSKAFDIAPPGGHVTRFSEKAALRTDVMNIPAIGRMRG